MTRIEQIWHKISFYNVTLKPPLPAWDHADCKSASSLSCKNQCFFKELKPANIFHTICQSPSKLASTLYISYVGYGCSRGGRREAKSGSYFNTSRSFSTSNCVLLSIFVYFSCTLYKDLIQ